MDKSAQDIREMLQRIGTGITQGVGQAGSSLANWYANLDPNVKKTVLRGLIGAAIGGGVTGGITAATPRAAGKRRPIISNALLGALMGGGAAAGLPYGLSLLRGDIRFKPESGRPLVSKGIDAFLYPFLKYPATTGGAILGGLATYKRRGPIMEAFRESGAAVPSKVVGPSGAATAVPGAAGLQRIVEMMKRPGGRRALILPASLATGAALDQYLKGTI